MSENKVMRRVFQREKGEMIFCGLLYGAPSSGVGLAKCVSMYAYVNKKCKQNFSEEVASKIRILVTH